MSTYDEEIPPNEDRRKCGNFLPTRLTFKMLEKVGTKGLKYFGQDKKEKNQQISAIFICHHCDKIFRAVVTNVHKDRITHCGCQKRSK